MTHRKATGISPRREPSGRPSRALAAELDGVSPAAAKRMRDAAAAAVGDPLWGSEPGRLFLCGKLTSAQFEAGKRWARLGVEYRQAIAAPHPYEKPGTLGSVDIVGAVNGYAGDDPAVDSPEGRRLREKRWRIIGEMEAALAVLGGLAEALRWTCELDRAPVGVAGLEALRAGLDVLGRLWGLVR